MSYTKRLTYWVDSPDRDSLEGCEIRYRMSGAAAGTAQLLVQDETRFVELILRDTGEGEYATGRRGHHGAGGYFQLDDESAVDDVLERLVREVWSWRPHAPGIGAAPT